MKIADFSFLNDRTVPLRIHTDIELFYIMAGSGELTIEEKKYKLGKEDFIVINSGLKHSFASSDPDYLGVRILFSLSELKEIVGGEMVSFLCNSLTDRDDRIDAIRERIGKLAREQYYNRNQNEMRIRIHYYEILDILISNFLIKTKSLSAFSGDENPDDRKQKIMEYVNQNFDRDISLRELSERLYLTNAYLSKYIKRQFGMTFVDYVSSVRVNYAASQLLYSDRQLSRIAADAGFSGTSAMNKAFRDRFQLTAVEYRKRYRIKETDSVTATNRRSELEKRIGDYFEAQPEPESAEAGDSLENIVVTDPAGVPFDKPWTKMINCGTLSDLLGSDMQRHILYLKETIGFRYVRFWGLYSHDLYLYNDERSDFNFDMLDRALDFLTQNDLIPYIELRSKPKILIQNGSTRIGDSFFMESREDLDRIRSFIRKMIAHMISRYSAETVETWFFEVWKNEIEQCSDGKVISDHLEDSAFYLDVFECIAELFREYLPNVRIGGGGLALRYGEEVFTDQLEKWKKRKYLPDFLSIYCYPYGPDAIISGKSLSLDENLIPKTIRRTRELMERADFPVSSLHVTEWNLSVSSRNVLNDHCMKAAYLTKCMIGTVGQTELMGYWVGSDLFSDYYDTVHIINGAPGLISKHGIPKPAFFAFDFMNRLGNELLASGEHYIITSNGKGSFRIVCHNLKYLSYHYGNLTEDRHIVETVDLLMKNSRCLRLHFELPAMPGREYTLRTNTLNQRNGSILDAWMDLSGERDLNTSDIEYLRRITLPHLQKETIKEQNSRLIFDSILEPNEIRYLEISLNHIDFLL